ncbi:Trn-SR [Cordylochernes scorpioides]|uniref:Trn-SR n=1 Tax=Cordylochernes scorpioides TaxID=51811 RepID=A0ABY6KP50_9ARAC|nr:Trn-SR [Cordylochernes scorpioides]
MGSWFSLPNFPEGPDANQEVILKYAFLEMDSQTYQSLATILFEGVYQLFPTYHNSVSNEEIDKDVNYCKIFTDLGESVVVNIIEQPNVNFGNLQTLDILLTCVGHYDYEVAEKTFHFWYTFSELLFKKNNEVLNQVFEPYIKRLIVALCRQCQLDTDHEGIPDERDDFCSFRLRVSDLIKDIIFIVGSSNVFIQMFENLKQQGSSATWDVTEASLFIMASVAKNILPSEREIVPQVLQALLNIPPTSHISILHTSCLLIRELSEWLDQHPEFLEPVIQFLMAKLRQRPLATAAADALQNLCSTCRGQMRSQFARLLEIVQSAESLGLSSEATQGLLKAATSVLIQMPHNLLSEGFCQLCNTQLHPLSEVLHFNEYQCIWYFDNLTQPIYNLFSWVLKSEAKLDPCMWVDNIAIIFRTAIQDRLVMPDGSHPCKAAVQISWPVLSQVLNKYRADVRMAERLCRCLRFLVRCIGRNSDFLLEPLVTQIVQLYQVHFHSCFLYLGSILVDEYGGEPNCHQGLLSMLQAMCSPTFQLLKQPGGFREHPDTVDDLFRLCARFLLRCPLVLLQNPELLMSVVSCGMAGASLDHKEANASVMKFFLELARCGHSRQESPDFPQRRNLVLGLLHEHGQSLVSTLLKASLFDLPTYVLPDIADVLFELVMLDQQVGVIELVCVEPELTTVNVQYMEKWLGEALQTVPLQGIVGPITVTSDQLLEFHYAVSK